MRFKFATHIILSAYAATLRHGIMRRPASPAQPKLFAAADHHSQRSSPQLFGQRFSSADHENLRHSGL